MKALTEGPEFSLQLPLFSKGKLRAKSSAMWLDWWSLPDLRCCCWCHHASGSFCGWSGGSVCLVGGWRDYGISGSPLPPYLQHKHPLWKVVLHSGCFLSLALAEDFTSRASFTRSFFVPSEMADLFSLRHLD